FEVRGLRRMRRGRLQPPMLDGRSVRFGYEGLDGVERASVVAFSDPPGRLGANRAEFMYPMRPEGRLELYIEIGLHAAPPPTRERFRAAAARAEVDMR